MAKKVWQVDGLRESIARRILKYVFPDNFFKLQLDQKTAEFKVWMIKKVNDVPLDPEDIAYFKEHFYGFNFILIDPEECDML